MKIAAIQAGKHLRDWELHVVREGGALRVLSNKQYAPERKPRPPEHRHDYGQNQVPVLSFDLHKTLTPDIGYPLLSDPFPGIKEGMDQMVSRNCCIHVISASLDFPDQDINDARTRIVKAWTRANGLPVTFVGPNAEATIRLDDRGIPIPENPDWSSIWGIAEKMLKKTYTIDKNGLYQRRDDLKPVGIQIDDDGYPDDSDVPQDQPRGFTTPLIDVDLHRTLMPAWGTRRDAPPNKDGVQCMREWYSAGYSIEVSCAGWNPATMDDPQFSIDRSAWQRNYLRKWGIPYDRLVAKDDCDIWFDDRVINYAGDWKAVDKQIRAAVGPPAAWPSRYVGQIPTAPIK